MTAPLGRMPEPARGALKGLLLDQVAAAAASAMRDPVPPVAGRPPGRLLVAACGVAAVAAAITATVYGAGGVGGSVHTVAADCYSAAVVPAEASVLSVRVVSVHARVTGGPATAVAAALEDCARLWHAGTLDGRGAADVPPLVACRAPHGRLAVYPGGDATCRQLGLASA